MSFYIFFLLANVFLSASNYHSSVLVPAYKTVAEWNVSPEVTPFVKGTYDINFFCDAPSVICEKRRLTYYFPGLPIPTIIQGRPLPAMTRAFGRAKESTEFGTYPSDYVVNDASAAGLTKRDIFNCLSFGQGEDAFRSILAWHALCGHGLKLDLDGMCFGTLRVINALFALGHPESYPGAEKFFTAAGIDRIDREKMLSMIQTISLNVSLKEPSHAVANVIDVLLKYGTPLLVGGSLLVNRSINNILLKGLVFTTAQTVRSGKRELGRAVFDASSSVFLPSYDSTYPSIEKMLNGMEHYKKDYPQLAALYMIKKNDMIVGGFDNDKFFLNLPVQDLRKYLMPSPDSNHVTIDPQQRAAKNAFFEKYGSSHYTAPSILQVGRKLLEHAQDNQYKNIDHYIAEMEGRDNYNLLSGGDGLNDENVLVGEVDFTIKKARL
jgi:hypothetical protein